MGAFEQALLLKDRIDESSRKRKQATKKSLWGSIGRAVGGIGAMFLTGGVVNPLTTGLITAGTTALGGAIGSRAAGKIETGLFDQAETKSLQKELDPLGTRNITASIRSGLMAGIGQSLKLSKDAPKVKEDTSFLKPAKGPRMVGPDAKITPLDIKRDPTSTDYLSGIKKVDVSTAQIPKTTAAGGTLSASEKGLYDTVNKMTDEGYPPTWIKETGVHGLPEEFGSGYIDKSGGIVRPPSRPDVDMPSLKLEDDYLTTGEQLKKTAYDSLDVNQPRYSDYKVNKAFGELQDYNAANTIEDPSFFEFDEASWTQGQETLSGIDKDLRVQGLQESLKFQNRLGGLGNFMSGYGGKK